MAEFFREYGLAAKIRIPVVKAGSSDLAVSADWTPATGDTKISKDGGAIANIGSNPAVISSSAMWEFTFTATEMQANELTGTVIDSATKAVQDQAFSIRTKPEHCIKQGTATGGSTTTVVDSGLAAGTDQFAGCVIEKYESDGTVRESRLITTNTSTTITVPTAFATAAASGTRYRIFPFGATPASVDSNGRVDVIKIAGTTQTARDLGASVLLSAGSGTGQLDFTAGVVKASLAQILGTALTETAGQIAAAFKQFFDVASPTGTMKAITNVVTATNLTNAPTNGDLTATMKTSVTTAASAATPAVTVSDKTGFSLAATGLAGTGTAPARVKKNTALTNFMIKMELTDGTPGTGLTVTVQRAIDGGAFAALAVTTVTEISGGWYKFNLAASDLNGDTIALKATATGAKQRDLLIVTQLAA